MDVETTPPRVAWQLVRSLRHAPPGRASRGKRKATFDAALEQAEQLFFAASGVGTATRPLLVFYGLSQAGRALAAVGAAQEWLLTGHGITMADPATRRDRLSDVVLSDRGKGSFTELSHLLGAASLVETTRLGDLWCLLPESRRFPLPGMGASVPLTVDVESLPSPAFGVVRARVGPIPAEVAHRVTQGEGPSRGQEVGWQEERARLAAFLDDYPSLRGWRFTTPEDNPAGLMAGTASLEWEYHANSDTLTTGYRGGRYAFPRIGGSDAAAHPLLIWWAVLYSLSMLARYQPTEWVRHTSINQSADANAIEHVLGESLVVLPELIHRTLLFVAGRA